MLSHSQSVCPPPPPRVQAHAFAFGGDHYGRSHAIHRRPTRVTSGKDNGGRWWVLRFLILHANQLRWTSGALHRPTHPKLCTETRAEAAPLQAPQTPFWTPPPPPPPSPVTCSACLGPKRVTRRFLLRHSAAPGPLRLCSSAAFHSRRHHYPHESAPAAGVRTLRAHGSGGGGPNCDPEGVCALAAEGVGRAVRPGADTCTSTRWWVGGLSPHWGGGDGGGFKNCAGGGGGWGGAPDTTATRSPLCNPPPLRRQHHLFGGGRLAFCLPHGHIS